MELLTTKNPMLRSINGKNIGDYRAYLLQTASEFNIATGFVSSESLVELQRIADLRKGELSINLFIGMNYLSGFTQLQYKVLERLDEYFRLSKTGNVYVSPKALFHGKMYSFNDSNGGCIGSFIGSSNLAGFLGVSQNNIEADIHYAGEEASLINKQICSIVHDLGIGFHEADTPTHFLPPEKNLLKGHANVKELTTREFDIISSKCDGTIVEIPLKAGQKYGRSNLNPYFGKGKTKGRYSPRSWYEVELIIPKHTPNIELLPDKEGEPITVVTPEHFSFQCERQGDSSKNFRSSRDLRILGKWIKGEMENAGVIVCGELVTNETLMSFGKTKIVLKKSADNYWLISME
jgi:HKD family nuclease